MNKKQEKFALEFVKDFNRTQAAIRAGYSKKTAYSQGSRLLKDAEIRARVSELIEEIVGETKESKARIAQAMWELLEDTNAGSSARVGAAKVLNDMLGFNSPIKQNVNITNERVKVVFTNDC